MTGHLAERTLAYAVGDLTEAEFAERPGLEPVWVQWLHDIQDITLTSAGLTSRTTAPTAADHDQDPPTSPHCQEAHVDHR